MCQTGDLQINEGKPFGNIVLQSDYSEMIRLGFRPGDSVDVQFSSGAVIEDIPFLSGCILPEGMLCLNAHESFDWIRVEKRFGCAWELFPGGEEETGRVVLREAQKYADLYQAFTADFSIDRADFPSDEFFANYRPLSGGQIQEGRFYRSTASFDPDSSIAEFRNREKLLDRLIERDGIRLIINMTCGREQMTELFESGDYAGSYAEKLYKEGRIFSDLFPVDFTEAPFRDLLAAALRLMLKCGGPVLIQCKAGVDRTGFFCGLMEALAGADASEIRDDYMQSYECLYGMKRETDREKYDILCKYQADRILDIIAKNGASDNLSGAAEKYLEGCGLATDEIAELKALLTGAGGFRDEHADGKGES